ncbi:Cinnamate reductase [anaerobic digester metagenome]
MEAARVAARRGHEVDLYEKTNKLGGVFIPASAMSFKEADKRLIEWYELQMKNEKVNVHMNTLVTGDLINEEKPDVIIAATGSTPRKLNIEGSDSPIVINAIDALLGKKTVGEKVAIIGGGLTGVEIAYELVKAGKKVDIIEMKDIILDQKDLCAANANMLKAIIEYYKIPVHLGANINKIGDHNIEFTVKDEVKSLDADTIITSIGYISDKSLYDAIKEKGIETHIIGDSNKVSNLLGAIWDGYELAMTL